MKPLLIAAAVLMVAGCHDHNSTDSHVDAVPKGKVIFHGVPACDVEYWYNAAIHSPAEHHITEQFWDDWRSIAAAERQYADTVKDECQKAGWLRAAETSDGIADQNAADAEKNAEAEKVGAQFK